MNRNHAKATNHRAAAHRATAAVSPFALALGLAAMAFGVDLTAWTVLGLALGWVLAFALNHR
ncbi:hypothetical protein [Nocardia nova]